MNKKFNTVAVTVVATVVVLFVVAVMFGFEVNPADVDVQVQLPTVNVG